MLRTVGQLLKEIADLKKDGKIDDDTKLITASDDEGNSYQPVYFTPEVLYFQTEIKMETDASELDHEDKITPHKYLCIN